MKWKMSESPHPLGYYLYIFLLLLVCIALVFVPSPFKSPYEDSTQRPSGRVIAVDNARVLQSGFIKTGTQDLEIEILDGPMQGKQVNAWNLLKGSLEVDKFFRPGDIALVSLNTDGDVVTGAQAADFLRLDVEVLLLVLFAVLLVIFSGWTGIKALLSFFFTILIIWKGLIPLFLKGWNPMFVSLAMLVIVTIVTMTLITGLSKTAMVAILGTLSGVFITWLLAVVLFPLFHLSGAVLSWSETVLYSGFSDLNLDHLFIAAIFIGASGAVMDLAIDVSTAMREIVTYNPLISARTLMFSGFSVGRAMTGTLVTTLLMAYTSGELGLIMAFMGKGIPLINILNTNYLAAEILRTIVGCLGLITVAPLTAVLGGYIFTRISPAQDSAESNYLREAAEL